MLMLTTDPEMQIHNRHAEVAIAGGGNMGRLAVFWQAFGGVDLSSFMPESVQKVGDPNVDIFSNLGEGWWGWWRFRLVVGQ
jgi:hypothetical protein